jgi:hypothetical protein
MDIAASIPATVICLKEIFAAFPSLVALICTFLTSVPVPFQDTVPNSI